MKKLLLLVVTAIVLAFLVQKFIWGSKIGINYESAGSSDIIKASSLCQQIGFVPNQAKCLAVVSQDPSFCTNIIFPPIKNECLALSTLDENYCNKLTLNAKKNCFNKLAEITRNPYFCDQGTVSPNDCYFEYSVGYRNPSYCEKVAYFQGDQTTICKAIAGRNARLCEATDGDDEIYCKAILEKNADLCERLPKDKRDKCYFHLAKERQDQYLCEMISEEKDLNKCLIEVAGKLLDPSICEELGFFQKGKCYFELARETTDAISTYKY